MLFSSPEMPQHLVLALDRHRELIEEARRQRMAHNSRLERPLRWRRLRSNVGELLIHLGQRLKTDTATDTVWG
jgi:hypothetical protein